MRRLEVYTGFDPEEIDKHFQDRGWQPATFIPKEETRLVRVPKDAPVECGDGRFDHLEDRTTHGVRILGGVNSIMALLTGGDEIGLQRAIDLLDKKKVKPGTHHDCGYATLWMAGRLDSARYPYKLHRIDRGGSTWGDWLTNVMRNSGGKHYMLNGNHKEEGVRLNPFRGYTEAVYDGSRFRIDDWFMADLGIPDFVRFFKIAEVVEKLKPDAAKLEIIVP